MFPIELLSRQSVLSHVLEWQAPKFTHIGQRAFLAEVVLAIVLVARRPSWRTVLPLAVFTAAALLGARNTVVASMIFLPGLALGIADLRRMTPSRVTVAGRSSARWRRRWPRSRSWR